MVRLPRNEKQTHRLNSRHEMGPSGLTLALTLNFQGQILNWLYLSQKWSDCHEMKSEHIDWTLGWNGTIGFDLGLDLDLEFSRSNTELAISQPKMVRLPRNEKRTHRLNSRPQMWPLDLTLALTLNFQGQIWNLLYLNQKWSDCHKTKSKHIDLNSRPQIWQMGLTLAMTLIFEFSRSYVILTIWWPRSGVRIYQIVTGVTSVVGVPSTRLVYLYVILCVVIPVNVGLNDTTQRQQLFPV